MLIGAKAHRIALGTPAYRRLVDAEHVTQALRLASAIAAHGKRWALAGYNVQDTACVAHSRNVLVHWAEKIEARWLLMVDADTHHVDPGPVLEMLEQAHVRGAAVVAAPVRMRKRTDGHNARVLKDGALAALPEAEFRGRVVEVEAIGSAFMAIDIDWIRRTWPDQPWFQFVHVPGPAPTRLGEDIAFCLGVRERGGTILCDGRFEPRHEGADYPIT
jgi:hypothetical protein